MAWRREPKVGGGPLFHAKFHPHRCNDKGVGPQKLKFVLRFDQNAEQKRPAGDLRPLRLGEEKKKEEEIRKKKKKQYENIMVCPIT